MLHVVGFLFFLTYCLAKNCSTTQLDLVIEKEIGLLSPFSSRRLVGQALLGFRLESPTRLSGQVGRLAGDLIFPVD
jgi:hypothetical protein